jgi:phenylalanyl-tRNA synthetase alpha chain
MDKKTKKWLEIMGCGLVHPNVINMTGLDSKRFSGFAFGMGVERMAKLLYEIEDMRSLFTNDIKFLSQ